MVDSIPDEFSKLRNLQKLLIEGHACALWPTFHVQPSFCECRALTRLWLRESEVPSEVDWLNVISAIASLPSLSDLLFDHVYLDRDAAHSWAFGSCLTNHEITESCLERVPDALVSLSFKRSLPFHLQDLEDFAAGPYLAHLTYLDIFTTIC